MKLRVLLSHFLSLSVALALSVAELPPCAQNCLSNSTATQTSCSVIDVACLCTSSTYVASLSCCLANNCNGEEQTTAIQFNKQECAAVNETAPDFVGCSPAGLSSALASAIVLTVPPTTASSASSATTTASSSAVNNTFSTITGDLVLESAIATSGKPVTATFTGQPILTGSCTVPYFALVTGVDQTITEFPAVGCSGEREDCCPFDQGKNAVITQCPQDYFTTSGACCPVGYQIYSTAIGVQTPCYSNLVTALVPASTPTVSGLALITNQVFSEKYKLAPPSSGHKGLPLGGEIGIIVNAVLFVAVIIAVWIYVRRRKAKAAAAAAPITTFPAEEPALQTSRRPTTHELDSPESQTRSPATARGTWPIFSPSSPLTHGQEKGRLTMPQELPGSTWLNEHHPAFSSIDTPTDTTPSSPMTPHGGETRSPVVSAVTPRSGDQSPPFLSPVSSPRLAHTSMTGDR